MIAIPTPAELYRLAYVPGTWVCPKCGFVWHKRSIFVEKGELGTTETDRQSEPCPNDGEWMEPQTYRSVAESACERMAFEMEQSSRLRLALRNCLGLAARHKGEGDWAHVLRFCAEAGVESSPLRSEAAEGVKGDA